MTPEVLLKTATLKWSFAQHTYPAKNNPDHFQIYNKGFTDGFRLCESGGNQKIKERDAYVTSLLSRIQELEKINEELRFREGDY